MKHTRAALFAGLTLTAASVGAFVPAHAADNPADNATDVTFSLTGGDLEISAPASQNLGSAAAGAGVVSGKLSPVTVTDTRGALIGAWTATASSTDWAHSTDTSFNIPKAAGLYTAGTVTSTGGGIGAGAGGTLAATVIAAVRTNLFAGNSTASWEPTIAVTVPPQSVVGTYKATITHSVS